MIRFEIKKTVTLRGIESDVAEKLKNTASAQGISVNQLLLDIVKTSLGVKKERKYTRVYDDLDQLFGRWSDGEFKAIQGKIDRERKIDPELWQSEPNPNANIDTIPLSR